MGLQRDLTSACVPVTNKLQHTSVDQGLLQLNVDSAPYEFFVQSDNCWKCPELPVCKIISEARQILIDTRWPVHYTLKHPLKHLQTIEGLKSDDHNILTETETICKGTYHFGEKGIYNLTVLSNKSCSIQIQNEPINSNLPFFAFLAGFVFLWILWHLAHSLYRYIVDSRSGDMYSENLLNELSSTINNNDQSHQSISVISNNNIDNNNQSNTTPLTKSVNQSFQEQTKKRLRFLDAFRGLSIVVMIFVNYGGGGYSYLTHSRWNGLTVADLVFPWFMFIMGTSMALSFESLARKQVPKLFFVVGSFYLGSEFSWSIISLMVFSGFWGDWSTLRIPGVLQRFSIAYVIMAIIRCCTMTKAQELRLRRSVLFDLNGLLRQLAACTIDIWFYWFEWLCVIGICAIWAALTFALPVPGCPTGYIGAGGLSEAISAFELPLQNCTGGASGYIDHVLLGKHSYTNPTCKDLYLCASYDPEGILGSLMSVLAVFLGLQAGNILVIYERASQRIVRLLFWSLLYGLLAGALCGLSQNEGLIPINKNLWSPSFVLVLACFANILIVVLYVLCDVFNWTNAAPFYFVGMNPIVIYLGHEVFSTFLPVQWCVAKDDHWTQMAMSCWGATFWVILAAYMHWVKFYITI